MLEWKQGGDCMRKCIIFLCLCFLLSGCVNRGTKKEEAAEIRNGYDTREEAKVLDAGLEYYFFETLEGLKREYNSKDCQDYVKSKQYEIIVFEFVADNSNHNKYCMVFR